MLLVTKPDDVEHGVFFVRIGRCGGLLNLPLALIVVVWLWVSALDHKVLPEWVSRTLHMTLGHFQDLSVVDKSASSDNCYPIALWVSHSINPETS